MTTSKFEKMSYSDLRKAQQEIAKALQTVRTKRLTEMRDEIQNLLDQEGFSLEEVFDLKPGGKGRKKTVGASGVPMYRHPTDPTKTWTGKGKRPGWFVEATEVQGMSREDLLIK